MKKRLILTIGERYNVYNKRLFTATAAKLHKKDEFLWMGCLYYNGNGTFKESADKNDIKELKFDYAVPRFVSVHSKNIEDYNMNNVEVVDVVRNTV